MRRLFTSLLFAVALVGDPSFAQEPESEDSDVSFVMNIWSSEEDCSAQNAETFQLEDLFGEPKGLRGKCVRVKGLWTGRALYSDMAAYYLAGPQISSLAVDYEGYRHRIGIYAHDKVMGQADDISLAEAEIFGIVGRCDDEWFMGGYCHYASGPYLAASIIEFRKQPLIRQTSEKARKSFGNLRFTPDDGAYRAQVAEIAWRWLTAIQQGDSEDFRLLHELDRKYIDFEDEDDLFHQVFRAQTSSFASFRGLSDVPQLAIFEQQSRPMFEEEEDEEEFFPFNEYESVACFCREADCSKVWPIADFDAKNAPERPYICVAISLWRDEDGPEIEVLTKIDWRSVREPPKAVPPNK